MNYLGTWKKNQVLYWQMDDFCHNSLHENAFSEFCSNIIFLTSTDSPCLMMLMIGTRNSVVKQHGCKAKTIWLHHLVMAVLAVPIAIIKWGSQVKITWDSCLMHRSLSKHLMWPWLATTCQFSRWLCLS